MSEKSIENDAAEFRYVIADGGAVITRCIARRAAVRVPDRLGGHPVIALGDECFASAELGVFPMQVVNGELESVELPAGLVRIGRAAFRGCNRLTRVVLPESLEQIDDLAFSCTSLGSARLPRACTRLGELALRTGAESLMGAATPYYSKLDSIEVADGNPEFCVIGGALCRRWESGALEAVLCPGRADEIVLGRVVRRLAPTAFSGTYEIGTLGFSESVAFADGCGIATNASCDRLVIELDCPYGGRDQLVLEMPSKELQRRAFECTRDCAAFDLATFLAAYDAVLPDETDRLLQAKLMIARLARPLHLGEDARAAFERVAHANFDTLCAQFGARGYWQGFDDLADAGVLDEQRIPQAIEVLTARADTMAVAYLLDLKRTRFGEGGWDYGL